MTGAPRRWAIGVVALAVAGNLLVTPIAANADDRDATVAELVTAAEAAAAAVASGQPVVATALTNETTEVTADPLTGLLTAEVTAGVARVNDGHGGWRIPSAALVETADGRLRTEAGAVPVSVSGGGVGPLLTVGEVAFEWPDALPAPLVEDNLATFAEVAPGIDLVVRTAVDGAESFLVINNADAALHPIARSIPITATSATLTPVVGDHGKVDFVDATGDPAVVLPPAYQWDSAGQPAGAGLAACWIRPKGPGSNSSPRQWMRVGARCPSTRSRLPWVFWTIQARSSR